MVHGWMWYSLVYHYVLEPSGGAMAIWWNYPWLLGIWSSDNADIAHAATTTLSIKP